MTGTDLRVIEFAAGVTDKRHAVVGADGRQVFPANPSRRASLERCEQYVRENCQFCAPDESCATHVTPV